GVWSPVWRPLATDAEFFAVLEIVQVEVDAAIQEALVRLASLIPPPGLSTDHELLVTYLEDLLEITTRAGSAIDARDVQAYETEAMKAPANTCATKSALSADMLLIAHGHFAAAEFCP
ncbi:MAG: hypothetical protein GTN93_02915, partial [Anaerolineae bacterium]|nr:hypothetical protein [Anaerolineae bacterium]